MRSDWQLQATAGFNFGVISGLDRVVTNEAQRKIILNLSERTLAALERQGPVMSEAALNALALGGEHYYTADLPTELFLRVGRYFSKLLQGTLTPEEKNAHHNLL